MNRRGFLKLMVSTAVSVSIPLHLCSVSICDNSVEQYRIALGRLAEQKTSRLRSVIKNGGFYEA